eukprot:jgi/Picsp_1/727/NSC_04216-R1_expressed protein [Chlorella variabilis]
MAVEDKKKKSGSLPGHEKRPQAQSWSAGGPSESKKGPKHRKGGGGCVIKLDKNGYRDVGTDSIKGDNNRLESDVPAASVDEEAILRLSDPEIPYAFGDSKSDWTKRLAEKCKSRLSIHKADDLTKEGIYVYKRPVRSGSSQHGMLVEHAGTVFHHVVVYVVCKGEPLRSFEFGPNDQNDVTENLMSHVQIGPVLSENPALPEEECLPMLRIEVEHSAIDAAHVQKALEFASSQKYNVLHRNCISFADFIVRVLTKNAVKHAPLLFDTCVGSVPSKDSPLLAILYMTQQLTWFDICDGGKLIKDFLAHYGPGLVEFIEKAAMGNKSADVRPHSQKKGGLLDLLAPPR